MTIDITPILKGDLNELDVDFLLEDIEGIGDVSFPKPVRVSGKIKDSGGYIFLSLESDVFYQTACARCLKEITGNNKITFEKTVSDKKTIQNEDNDDYVIANNGLLDIDELLIENILLEFPSKFLCKEDCKGLCPKCGCDLNEKTCNCDTTETDPRFDVLKKLLENNKK